MSATIDTRAAAADPVLAAHRTPTPVTRLLRVQLEAWRAQRGIVWTTALALVLGLAATAIGMTVAGGGGSTAASVQSRFATTAGGFQMLWLAVGVVAGAAPFRAGWASLILSVAPGRIRWLAAAYLSILGWALAATALFAPLAWAATAVTLLGQGHPLAAATGVLAHLPHLAATVALQVSVGFALGAGLRSVTVPILLGYVATASVGLLDMARPGLSRWVDLNAATAVLSGASDAPHGAAAPVAVTLACWLVAPAVVAAVRLSRSDLR
jgi:hypothetical protein